MLDKQSSLEPELEPPEPAHFARSRSRHILPGAGAGAAGTKVVRSRSRSRSRNSYPEPEPEPSKVARLRIPAMRDWYGGACALLISYTKHCAVYVCTYIHRYTYLHLRQHNRARHFQTIEKEQEAFDAAPSSTRVMQNPKFLTDVLFSFVCKWQETCYIFVTC